MLLTSSYPIEFKLCMMVTYTERDLIIMLCITNFLHIYGYYHDHNALSNCNLFFREIIDALHKSLTVGVFLGTV